MQTSQILLSFIRSGRSRLSSVGAVMLCCAASACSGSSSPGDTATGGSAHGSGGVAAPGGGTGGMPAGPTGGSPGSTGTGGSVVAAGTGGASQPGTGGSDQATGTGGTATQPGSGGSTGGGAGRGGSPNAGGAGGATSTGGATGNGGGGGSKTPPDTSNLPAITIHLAGDSTVMTYAASTTQEGWGQEFGQFFNSKVTINNQGQGGANIQSFYGGRWKTLLNNVKAGDYVLAMFGINDSGTAHGPVAVPAFTTQMGAMADEVAAKKATFIPTTSSPLQVWVGGKETNTRLQPYADATIALGMTKNLLVDDLNARGVEYYNMIGQTAAADLTFNGDKAHFDKAGATAMASLAAKELVRINSPLAAYLK